MAAMKWKPIMRITTQSPKIRAQTQKTKRIPKRILALFMLCQTVSDLLPKHGKKNKARLESLRPQSCIHRILFYISHKNSAPLLERSPRSRLVKESLKCACVSLFRALLPTFGLGKDFQIEYWATGWVDRPYRHFERPIRGQSCRSVNLAKLFIWLLRV